MAISQKARKRIFYGLLVFLGISLVGGFFANRWVKTKGYSNLWEFITTTSSNYKKSFSAQYETLSINIDEKDFKKLEAQRQRALDWGIMINEEGSYVDAVLEHNGQPIRAEVRLKGHMTDHLQENKWSFRIKTKKGDAFMGMRRFSVQHPGTRNYIHEWIYHQMMENEGIMALRYMFLKVKVNGDDWGIYALEEHFGQELVEHNDRMKGPIIRYNPELYWAYRINELNKVKIVEEYAQLQSSYFEPYETKAIMGDSSLRELFIDAMNRLEGFRRGQLRTSQVFDIEKLAKFHAIVDVVGGHHSLDWSDVKYYYNSETQLLEPVAYESFSVRNVERIAGSYRFSGDTTAYINDHHNALFNDTAFFAAYVRELDRIATREWMDAFLKEIDPILQSNLNILYKEFAYKKYDSKGYYRNIESIAAILRSPRGFYAHLESMTKDSVKLSVGGIESLPSLITALLIDTLRIPIEPAFVVPAKMAGRYVNYRPLHIALAREFTIPAKFKMELEYTLPGRTQTKKQDVFSYPAYDAAYATKAYLRQPANHHLFPFLKTDESSRTIVCAQGTHVIEQDLVIPSGYKVIFIENTRIILNRKARLLSYSTIEAKGTEDAPVVFESSDSSGQGIVLLKSNASRFSWTIFRGLDHPQEEGFAHKAALNLVEASASFNDCDFSNCRASAIQAFRTKLNLTRCYFADISKDALRFYFVGFVLDQIAVSGVKDDGLVLNNSFGQINNSSFKKVKGKAIVAEDYSGLRGSSVSIEKSGTALEALNGSDLSLTASSIEKCKLAAKAHSKGGVFGPATITLKEAKLRDNEVEQESEKGSSVHIQTKGE